MGQLSRKALSVVLSGLLATSMFTALPARAGATEELEPVPMQQEKQPSGNASQAPQGTAQMGEDTAPAPANDAQSLELTAQSDDAAAQPTELAAQSEEAAAQSEEAPQTFELVPQNDALPASFDLRAKGLVTPVKIQNPWQSCWAFAGTAAAETSILSMLQEKGQAADAKSIDLSEKHLTWFAVQPVIEQVDQTQVGEGIYTIGQEGDPTAPYDNGGMPLYITTLFSAGVGPVPEENFPYRGSSGLTEKQYYEAHPDEGKAFVSAYYGKNFLQGHTMEEAVAHPNDEPYKSFLDNKIYGEGYLSKDNRLTLDALEDACLRRYLAIQATTNCYTKLDDWSLPALDASGEPNRNLTAGYTLVDGNQLPDTRITEQAADPDDPRVWTGVNWDGVNAIKGELMKGRAVSGSFKADVAVPGAPIPPNSYMNYDTWAHYTYENVWPSHAICIVGWDDNYSASNFKQGHLPPGNGAWIVKNSWGSQTDYVTNETGAEIGKGDWGVKDASGKHTGYFYLSYYDKTLQACESMSFDTDLHENGEFYVEMYDYMPSMTSSNEDTAEQSDSLVKTANVFKNDAGSYASLRSVSTKTARPNATVKYSVYRLKDGFQNPEDGELLGTKTATYDYAGFHRERLDGFIGLRDGETFSVVAEETVEEGGNTRYEYAVNSADAKEYVTSDKAEGETDYGIAVVNKGESFIFEGGKWTDWSEYEPRTSVSKRYAIDNFSIKAYLVATSEPIALALTGSGHVQNVGDKPAERTAGGGIFVGTTGQSLRLEAFTVGLPEGTDGGIEYRGHIQNKGWDEWAAGGKPCGTTGQALRVEAAQMRLTGGIAGTHDVWYRVHAQNYGWLGWAKDGQAAGTAGQALRAEALEVQVLPKGEAPRDYEEGRASYVGAVTADVHVQNTGWTGAQSALEFGTTGQARRLEAIRLSQPATPVDGGITYEVHAQDKGWMPAAADGALAGTTGEAKRLEAVRVSLTGDAAKEGGYSVWYRVHSQDYGWLGWAHDGAEAGTSGLAKRAEAIDVQVLPQGQVPDGYDAGKAACVTA